MEYHPLTPERWNDFEELLGVSGACGGCWCMWWRLTRAEFDRQKGESNRLAMKAIVDEGRVPGIIGYVGGRPVAWCSVAPRTEYGSLERSRVLRRVDDAEVWSIVCFFVARERRGSGMTEQLVRAAIEYVRGQGGAIVEAYPTAITSPKAPSWTTFMGFPEVFVKVGFAEVARPSRSKRILRYDVAQH